MCLCNLPDIGISAITDEQGLAHFELDISAAQGGLKYLLFTVDDGTFATNFESSKPFYVSNNIESLLVAPFLIGTNPQRGEMNIESQLFFWCDYSSLQPSSK